MSPPIDPAERAAEISGAAYGSGHRISARLVLTAAHVAGPVGARASVRRSLPSETWPEENASTVWVAPGDQRTTPTADIAVVELDAAASLDGPEFPQDSELVIGRLASGWSPPVVDLSMVAWPRWGRGSTDVAGETSAGRRSVPCTSYTDDLVASGLLVIEPTRHPLSSDAETWQGASGAAVVGPGGSVMGVLVEHDVPSDPRSLRCAPLAPYEDDAGLRRVLEQHGVRSSTAVVRQADARTIPALQAHALVDSWRSAGRAEAGRIRSSTARRPYVWTRGAHDAAGIIHEAPWNPMVLSRLRAIVRDDLGAPVALLRDRIDALEIDASSMALAASLLGILRTETFTSWVRSMEAPGRGGDDAATAAADVLTAVRDLRRELERPRLGLASVVIGSWGSGRTRLTEESVRSVVEPGVGVVADVQPTSGSIERAVCRSIRDQAGFEPEALRHADQVLGTTGTRCLVVIDDVRRFGRADRVLPELIDLIEDGSGLASIRWLVTVDAISYTHLIGSQFDRGRWERVTARRSPRRGTGVQLHGWYDQTAANEAEGTGLQVLERHALPATQQVAATYRSGSGSFSAERRLLGNPRNAWLRVSEEQRRGTVSASPSTRARFVDAWWRERLGPQGAGTGSSASPLVDLVGALIRASARSIQRGEADPGRVGMRDLVDELRARPAATLLADASVEEALAALAGEELIELGGDKVELLGPEVWGLRIGVELAALLPEEAAITAARSWCEALGSPTGSKAPAGGRRRTDLVETILAAFLATVGSGVGDRAGKIWRGWPAWTVPSAPFWLALADQPSARQDEALKKRKATNGLTIDSTRDLFALASFVQAATEPDRAAARLRLLQPHHARAHRYGLDGYVAYAIESVLDRPGSLDEAAAASVLLALLGTEESDNAERSAEAAVRALSRDLGSLAGAVDVVLAFVDQLPAWNRSSLEFQIAPDADDRPFWLALIRAFARRYLRQAGPAGFEHLLHETRWFRPEPGGRRPSTLSFHLRVEATQALAEWYRRTASPRLRAGYVELVERLAGGGDPTEADAGVYLVRHSVRRRDAVRPTVDAELRPAIRLLLDGGLVSGGSLQALHALAAENDVR